MTLFSRMPRRRTTSRRVHNDCDGGRNKALETAINLIYVVGIPFLLFAWFWIWMTTHEL